MTKSLPAPRMDQRGAFRVAGKSGEFTFDQLSAVPALWAEFVPYFGAIDGQVGYRTYGLSHSADENGFTYIAGVEIGADAAPADLTVYDVGPSRYAVWTHEGHVSEIRMTFAAIFDSWLKDAGLTYAPGCDLEIYDERFDPKTGSGIVEIWIPVE